MNLATLTFTRFLAAMWVVTFHYGRSATPFDGPGLREFVRCGPVAVSYFFVLSGFIMAVVYGAPRGNRASARDYWIARAARIYPVYLLALAVPAGFDALAHALDFKAAWLSMALVQSWVPAYALSLNTPGWSLSVEAFFYLLFPALLWWSDSRSATKLIMAAAIFWVVSQAIHIALYNFLAPAIGSTDHEILSYNPLFHLNAFVLGLAAGLVCRRRTAPLCAHVGAHAWLFGSVAAVVLLCTVYSGWVFGIETPVANGLLAPLFVVTIVALAALRGPLACLLAHRFAVLLGEASYAVYLLQYPLWLVYSRVFGNSRDTLHFWAYVALLILVSVVAYRWFERPTRTWLRDTLMSRNGGLRSGTSRAA